MAAGRVRYRTILSDSQRWDDLPLRSGDIIISTPPKCGTTWTQMICALLIFRAPELPAPLDRLSPWLDMLTRPIEDVVRDLEAQQHRRFIKSHTPFDGLPFDPGVTFICVARDPRDVFLSWDNHLDNMDMLATFVARHNAVGLDDIADKLAEGPPVRADTEIERFFEWVDDPTSVTEGFSLHATLHLLTTFYEQRSQPNVVLWHYDDLMADLEGKMRALAGRLGIDVEEDGWPALVEAASFASMRARADVVAPDTTNEIWLDNERFFNKGTSGQWRRILDDDALECYFARCHELAPPEVVAWAHRDT